MKTFSKKEILSAINILDIAVEQGLSVEEVSSGNFTHRCKCPGIHHKGGSERTGSLYIDSIRNNFYCFGCGASNNAIDFYMLCTDLDFGSAIKSLSENIDPSKISSVRDERVQNNFSSILDISNLFRRYQRAHPEDILWIEEVMKKTDVYLAKISRTDVASTISLYGNIKRVLNRRYS